MTGKTKSILLFFTCLLAITVAKGAFAATDFVSMIRASGGDYSALSTWETAIQSDLTLSTSQVFTVSSRGTYDGADDNQAVTFTGGGTGTLKHINNGGLAYIIGVSGTVNTGTVTVTSSSHTFTISDTGDQIGLAIAECYDDWASGLADRVYINSWTTDSNNYVKIYTPKSERHNGTRHTGFYLKPSSYNDYIIHVGEQYTVIDGIELDGSGTKLDWNTIALDSTSSVTAWTASNNLIYDMNGDTRTGVYMNYASTSVKIFNNIIINCDRGITFYPGYGSTQGTFYNNTVYGNDVGVNCSADSNYSCAINNTISANNGTDFAGTGYLNSSNNISSDGTAPGTNPLINITVANLNFKSTTAGGEDLHIQDGSTAQNAGTGFAGVFTTDTDGENRNIGGSAWDVGADEIEYQIYRSVGPTNTTALETGSGNDLTISGTTATFTDDIPTRIGVGDIIQYDSDNNSSIDAIAFIHGRTSATSYTIKNVSGGVPSATTAADQNWSIFRAYTSLSNAEAGIENTGIDSTLRNFDDWTAGGDATTNDVGKNIDTANELWNIALYADGTDITPVTIDGWTTSVDNYVKISTPTSDSEAGANQRHRGKAGSGYRLHTATNGSHGINIVENYTVIDGVEVKQESTGISDEGIRISSSEGATINNSIVWTSVKSTDQDGIYAGDYAVAEINVYNTIVYGFARAGIHAQNHSTSGVTQVWNILNCTVYENGNIGQADSGGIAMREVSGSNITANVKNSVIMNTTNGYDFEVAGGSPSWGNSQYNISSDSTADCPYTEYKNFVATSNSDASSGDWVIFRNLVPGSEDFHLVNTDENDSLNVGIDLSSVVAHDIDNQLRTTWDIGADEATNEFIATVMQSGGDYSTLALWEAGIQTDLIADSTRTFSNGGVVGTIVDGDSVIGSTSGATATVVHVSEKQVLLENISGTFQNGEQAQVDASNHITISDDGRPASATASIEGDWANSDSNSVLIEGWETGSENYINIYTAGEARHQGYWDDLRYSLEMWISAIESYVRVDGLQIMNQYSNDAMPGGIVLFNPDSGDGEFQISNNIIKFPKDFNHDDQVGILGSSIGNQTVVKIWNNIILDANSGINLFWSFPYNSDWMIYNNTIVDSKVVGFGFIGETTTDPGKLILRNNIITGSRLFDYYFLNTDDLTRYETSNNISSDATSPDGASFQNKTIDFDQSDNGNFHLALGETDAIGQGADLSADSDFAFSTDIDGTTRGATWDIGADEKPVPFLTTVMESGGDFAKLSDWEGSFSNVDLRAPEDKVFSHGGVTGSLSVGDSVTGVTSSATGSVISAVTGNQILLENTVGTFVSGEQVQLDASNHVTLSSGGEPASLEAKIDGSWTSSDAESATVYYDNWHSDYDNSVRIYTTPTARHDGKWDTSAYRLELNTTTQYSTPIYFTEGNVEVDGLQIDCPNTPSGSGTGASSAVGDESWIKFSNNIIRGNANSGHGISIQGGREAKIFNNIIYDWNDTGIRFSSNSNNSISYVANNTIENITQYWGIAFRNDVSGSLIAKNNIVQNTNSSAFDGTYATGSGYNISDDTTAPGTNSKNSTTISFQNLASEDYHLAESDPNARAFGENLSSFLPMPFAVDVDGQSRPQDEKWDVGADEVVAAVTLHRSVGTNSANLNTGTATVGISGTTATFSAGMPDNIGVGDVLQYGAPADLTFIISRTSDTIFEVSNSVGGTPTAISAGTTVNVYRAYTSLTNWESQTENTSFNDTVEDFDTSTDLSTSNSKMFVACYGDGADTTAVTIDGWTTGIDNYIKIYTPTSLSEVGVSQRHNGKWDDGKYSLTYTADSNNQGVVSVADPNVEINGIQVKMIGGSYTGVNGFSVRYADSGFVKIHNTIVASEGNGAFGMYLNDTTEMSFYNNIMYGWDGEAIQYYSSSNSNSTFANNTIINNETGFALYNITCNLINNISYNNVTDYSLVGNTTHSNNISSDATSPDSSYRDKVVQFVDTTNNNFHLSPDDAVAIDVGTDLSSDSILAFSDDVDGHLRTSWDIGADEASIDFAPTVMQSGGDYSTLALWETGIQTDLVADTTRVFSHGGITGTITDDDTVVGYQSGATATAVHVSTSQILLKDISGTFENGEQIQVDEANYVTVSSAGNPANAVAKIDGAWTSADTTIIAIDGWITGVNNHVKIYTTETARHNGKWDSSKYIIQTSNYGNVITINEPHVEIYGLQVYNTHATNGRGVVMSSGSESADSDVRVGYNIIKGTSQNDQGIGNTNETNIKIFNNIVYDFDVGIYVYKYTTGAYTWECYNNTVVDNDTYGFQMYGNGDDAAVLLYNNIVQGATDGYYSGVGAPHTSSDFNISDLASDAPGSNSFNSTTVSFVDEINNDFHLSSTDTAARDAGTASIFTDTNLNFITDIDGTDRGAAVDIGADELPREFVSTICEGPLAGGDCENMDYNTLASWEAANDTDLTSKYTRVFSGSTTLGTINPGDSLQSCLGAIVVATGDVVAVTSDQILFENIITLLSIAPDPFYGAAGVEISDSCSSPTKTWTISGTGDDLGASAQVVAKIDGSWSTPDTAALWMLGWNTDTDNMIKIYTTDLARHEGKKGTGYQLILSSGNYAIVHYDDYIWFDGLEISSNQYSIAYGTPFTKEIKFSNNIVFGGYWTVGGTGTYKIWNNIFHSDNSTAINTFAASNFAYVYNNTFYHADNPGNNSHNALYGSSNVIVKNNVAYGYGGISGYKDFTGSFHADSDNNISSDDSAPGSNSVVNTTINFVDVANRDFHLPGSSTDAINEGADLSSDSYISLVNDIDGGTRNADSAGFDIGADEAPTQIYRSVGPENVSSLQTGTGNNMTISTGVATFASAIASDIGVGDAIQYDSDDNSSIDAVMFIHERTDSTHYEVRGINGEALSDMATADQNWSIFRAYTSLRDAETGRENDGIDDAVENFDDWVSGGGKDDYEIGVNLLTSNLEWNFACYNDAIDDKFVIFDGWNTGVENYIKIFTPTEDSQVGISQRHNGKAFGLGYQHRITGTQLALSLAEDSLVGSLNEGDLITGLTSGSTATVLHLSDFSEELTLSYEDASGAFQEGEVIQVDASNHAVMSISDSIILGNILSLEEYTEVSGLQIVADSSQSLTLLFVNTMEFVGGKTKLNNNIFHYMSSAGESVTVFVGDLSFMGAPNFNSLDIEIYNNVLSGESAVFSGLYLVGSNISGEILNNTIYLIGDPEDPPSAIGLISASLENLLISNNIIDVIPEGIAIVDMMSGPGLGLIDLHPDSTNNLFNGDELISGAFGNTAATGVVTGLSANQLVDSTANFTSTISEGMIILNGDEGDTAYVVSIDSDTELTLSTSIFLTLGENYLAFNNRYGEADFVDINAHNYHLDSNDTSAINQGSNKNSYFTRDIDEHLRTSWDIGADEASIDFAPTVMQSGGDYSSLSTWESSVQADLLTDSTRGFLHGGITGTLGDGANVTGVISKATATVVHATTEQVLLETVSGTFTSGEDVCVNASISPAITREQYATSSNITASATLGTVPTAGNLLVAISAMRVGEDTSPNTASISGTGWTRVINDHFKTNSSVNDRRGLAIFYKIAGASEPTNIQTNWDPAGINNLIVAEYSTSEGAFAFDVATSNNSGITPVTSLSSGTTATTATTDSLLVTGFAQRGDSGAASWTNSLGNNVYFNANSISAQSAFVLSSTQGAKESTATWSSSDESTVGIAVFSVVAVSSDCVTISDSGHPANAVAKIDGEWTSAEIGDTLISGWETAANNYIKVYTTATARHDGKWDESAFRIDKSSGYGMDIRENFVKIEGLQIDMSDALGAGLEIHGDTGTGGGQIDTSDNIIIGNAGTSSSGIYFNNQTFDVVNAWNNVIYGFTNNASGQGIRISSATHPAFLYNNTIYNCGHGLRVDNTSTAINNLIANTPNPFDGNFTTQSDYNAVENTDVPTGGGTNNITGATFSFISTTAEEEDLHLLSSDTGAKNKGTSSILSDENLVVTTDIDGDSRGDGDPDVGADEVLSENFRSVGPSNVTTLQNGSGNNLTISGTVATFSSAIADRIGIGDVIQYDSDNNDSIDSLVFIHRRISNTQFIVRKNTGEVPTVTTAADQNWDIFRAYTSLSNATRGIENTGIESSLRNFDDWTVGGDASTDDVGNDLVAINQQWNIACYGDAVDSTSVYVDGWTTGVNNYVKMYTPVTLNEVGVSQRHSGVWDDGKYHIADSGSVLGIVIDYLYIDGLQIESNTAGDFDYGIFIANSTNVYVSNNIIRDTAQSGISREGISDSSSDYLYIWNNIIYGFNADSSARGIALSTVSSPGAWVYNNTIHDSYTCYRTSSNDVVAINNISQNCTDGYLGTFDASSDYNTSDIVGDTTGLSASYRSGLATEVSFIDETNDNFHLLFSDTAAKDNGSDLSANENITFWLDVDGEARAYGIAWDIGADESVNTNMMIRGGVNIKGGVEIKN